MKKIMCMALCFLLLFTALSPTSARALGKMNAVVTMKTAKSAYVPGEEIVVILNLQCGTSIKSFNLNLAYDKNVLEFEKDRTERIQGVNGQFQQYEYDNRLRVTYAYEGSGKILSGDSTDAITLVFTVKDNATAGTTSITPSAGSSGNDSTIDTKPVINKSGKTCTVTYQAARLTISSASSMKANAKLSSLTVSGCTLRPAFHSDTLSYKLYVPDSVTSLQPKAVTVNDAATAKIKTIRKNNAVTKLQVVVTAADKTTTNTYELAIHRGDPPASGGQSSESASSGVLSSTASSASNTSSETVTSTVFSEPSSAAASENGLPTETSSEDATAVPELFSEVSSSSEPQDFWGSLVSEASALPKNKPMLLLMAGFVVLVLLLLALPLSKRKKRKYINYLLRRGYIINPQFNPMNGSFMPMQGGLPGQWDMGPGETHNMGEDGNDTNPYQYRP